MERPDARVEKAQADSAGEFENSINEKCKNPREGGLSLPFRAKECYNEEAAYGDQYVLQHSML
ncbi:MAG: hypothetical protein ACLSIT_03140 [Christensenellales bacterium]|nr:hypothetical protein [Christensenellales bacterium]